MIPSFDQLCFGPRYDIAAYSSVGAGAQLRPENQDNFLLIDTHGEARFLRAQREVRQQVPGWPQGHARIAVLDGMGGHGQGREAAEAVVDGLLSMPACDTLGELSALLDALHSGLQLHFGGDDPARRPGTTLTLLELRHGQSALLFHVGDSRMYEIVAGRIMPLTVDHVPATAFAMAGLLGEGEWWQQVHGEHRSQISQAFILGNAFANPALLDDPLFALTPLHLPGYLRHLPDRRALELHPGATYLLATDGFWACGDPVGWVTRWPALIEPADSAHSACAALFTEIETRPPRELHSDNLTAIVLRMVPDHDADQTALPAESLLKSQ
jgi:serine/threonine protein phosphatase PrpC